MLNETIALIKEQNAKLREEKQQTPTSGNMLQRAPVNMNSSTINITSNSEENRKQISAITQTYAKSLEAKEKKATRENLRVGIEDITDMRKGGEKPSAQNTPENEFTLVTNKRKARVQTKRIGNANNEQGKEHSFEGTASRLWLYLYRVKETTQEDNILKFIESKPGFQEASIVVKEIPSDAGHLKRFVVAAPLQKKDEMYSREFWPPGVGISRFDFRRHRGFLQQRGGDFL